MLTKNITSLNIHVIRGLSKTSCPCSNPPSPIIPISYPFNDFTLLFPSNQYSPVSSPCLLLCVIKPFIVTALLDDCESERIKLISLLEEKRELDPGLSEMLSVPLKRPLRITVKFV